MNRGDQPPSPNEVLTPIYVEDHIEWVTPPEYYLIMAHIAIEHIPDETDD